MNALNIWVYNIVDPEIHVHTSKIQVARTTFKDLTKNDIFILHCQIITGEVTISTTFKMYMSFKFLYTFRNFLNARAYVVWSKVDALQAPW